jgi:chromosomal replication initiation ATPase DnaA
MIPPARFMRNPIDTFLFNFYTNRKPRTRFTMQRVERIRMAIKEVTGIDPAEDTSDRFQDQVKSRQYFMYFVRKYTKLSLRETGLLINKDHATVIWAIECVKKFQEIEPEYADISNNIDKRLKKILT